MKESVLSLKEKTTQHWFSYFQIARMYYNYFTFDTLTFIFNGFSIRLLGSRIEHSCLYIP